MFDWLYKLLGMMLSFFNSITGSYALALLLYALVFKLLFLPFGIKQQKNQIKMAKLTPKIALIRAKYKGRTDQRTMQKQQQEIMELQQKEGYSPLSGCLPLLLQLPIILLLYAVIRNPISYIATTTPAIDNYNEAIKDSEEYKPEDDSVSSIYADFVSEKKEITQDDIIAKLKAAYKNEDGTEVSEEIDLINLIMADIRKDDGTIDESKVERLEKFGIDYESIPSFYLFGVNLAKTPSFKDFSLLLLIPVIAAALTWLSMWISRKLNGNSMAAAGPQDAQTQASMRIMDLVMPLMTLWLAFTFSGMLGLYWIYQSILGIAQTFILAKAMPLPKYTEEELKEMRKAEKAAEKAQRAALKENPKYRSLHYIDEDDYEELPEVKSSEDKKNTNKKNGGIDIPDIKD